jgi:alkylation response protein AidB-like acyl-CoA dehydrogenase
LSGIRKIRRAAAETPSGFGDMLSEDPAFQRKLGALEAEIHSFNHYEKLALSGGDPSHDPAFPSIKKTIGSELSQQISAMMIDVAGLEGLPRQLDALRVGANVEPLGSDFDLLAMPYYLNARATTIYAGSNEIQRDLISRSLPTA